MNLRDIFKKHGCDRWEHGYDYLYEKDWADRRDEPIRILEIGVWNGYGVNAWLEYFPNAEIVGIDIFTRLKIDEVKLDDPDRVTLHKADSQFPHIYADLGEFDMIVDDAQHTPDANKNTFKYAVNSLKKGGMYYVEDVWPLNIMTDKEKSIPWIRNKPGVYSEEEYQKFLDELDGYDTVMIDMRAKCKPDSCIFRITK